MADDWTSLVPQIESQFGLPAGILHAVIATESSGRPTVKGKAGERGLMQIMPATAHAYGITNPDELDNPKTNLEVGARYLSSLLKAHGGDLPSALASYNGGPKATPKGHADYIAKVMRNYRAPAARPEAGATPSAIAAATPAAGATAAGDSMAIPITPGSGFSGGVLGGGLPIPVMPMPDAGFGAATGPMLEIPSMASRSTLEIPRAPIPAAPIGGSPGVLQTSQAAPGMVSHPTLEVPSMAPAAPSKPGIISRALDFLGPSSAEAAEDPLAGATIDGKPLAGPSHPGISAPVTNDPLAGATVGGRPLDPTAVLPPPPTPMAPPSGGYASLNSLASKQQFNIAFHVQRGTPDSLKKYLTGQGYQIVGEAPDGITFRKGDKIYQSGTALAPAATNALPAVGQIGGTIGGGALTGGLGGEIAGSAIGQGAGEALQQGIYQHYSAGQIDPKEIAKNAAIAGATQGVFGGVVPGVAKSLSGVNAGTAAEAAREAEIAAAGDEAVQANAGALLKQGTDVGALREQLQESQRLAAETRAQQAERAVAQTASAAGDKKFATADEIAKVKGDIAAQIQQAQEGAAQRIAAQQETGELQQTLGTTQEEAQARRGVLIQGDQPWPAEPYFKALNQIQDRQGKLFDDVLKGVKNEKVNLNLGPTVQEMRGRPYMAGLSGKTERLLDEAERIGGPGEMTDYQVIAAVQGPKEAARAQKAGADAVRMQAQLSRRILEGGAGQGIGAPLPQPKQGGATVEELMNLRSRFGEIARSRNARPIDKAAAYEMMDKINDALFETPGLKNDPGAQLALKTARQQYARYKNIFTPSLTAKVAASRDPVEFANVIFGRKGLEAHPKIVLNMIEVLQDDPESMDALRSSYADKIIMSKDMKDARIALSIHDKNGVLERLYPNSQYRKLKTWIDTQNYQQFAQRALSTPDGQAAFNAEFQRLMNTPEGQKLQSNLRQLEAFYKALPEPEDAAAQAAAQRPPLTPTMQHQVDKRAANLRDALQKQKQMEAVDPEQLRTEAMDKARAEQSPHEAAVEKLRNGGRAGGFAGRMIDYMKRRALFGAISGYGLVHPAALLVSGPVFGYDALWAAAMATPKTADLFYSVAKSLASPGKAGTTAHLMMDLLSAMAAQELKQHEALGARRDLREPNEPGANP